MAGARGIATQGALLSIFDLLWPACRMGPATISANAYHRSASDLEHLYDVCLEWAPEA
jgi:hypothetical protein